MSAVPPSPDDLSEDVGATLLAQVCASPDDDAPRAVYADWLQARGDERGEFIALQLHRSGTGARPTRRERSLLARHKKTWAGPLGPVLKRVEFERGFVVGGEQRDWVPLGDEIVQAPDWRTLRFLAITYTSPQAVEPYARLIELGGLECLRRLTTDSGRLVRELVRQGAPELQRVSALIPHQATLDSLRQAPRIRQLDVQFQPKPAEEFGGGRQDREGLVAQFFEHPILHQLDRVTVEVTTNALAYDLPFGHFLKGALAAPPALQLQFGVGLQWKVGAVHDGRSWALDLQPQLDDGFGAGHVRRLERLLADVDRGLISSVSLPPLPDTDEGRTALTFIRSLRVPVTGNPG
jgi:uncharacterized protein (TIGR02996 family)